MKESIDVKSEPPEIKLTVSCLVSALAAMFFLCGGWLSAAFTFGFGAGDTWIFYPPTVTPIHWLIAVGMIGFSLWWFLRLVKNQERITRGQFIGILILLAILVAIVAPLCVHPAWKG